MGERMRFPVLGIAPTKGKQAEAGEESCFYLYNAKFFSMMEASELKRGERDDMLLIDSKFRCWKVEKVIDLGIAERSWLTWLLDLISRDPTHNVDYQLTPLEPMMLEQVHDRIAQAILSNPWDWYDDERIAGEDGEPVEQEVLLEEYVARVRKAKTMAQDHRHHGRDVLRALTYAGNDGRGRLPEASSLRHALSCEEDRVKRTIAGQILNAAAVVLAAVYLLALLPIAFLGLVAFSDYGDRGCPGAMQCSDAVSSMALAAVYVIAAPIVWLVFQALRTAAGASRRENDG